MNKEIGQGFAFDHAPKEPSLRPFIERIQILTESMEAARSTRLNRVCT